MTPPTTVLDRVRLRLRSRRDLERAVAAAEQDRDSARALAMGWRRERDAAKAHASHWRRDVGELVGWQSEGRTDGELLRRLQRIVADGGRAQEVADRARDDEEAAYEAMRRVANALRPGCRGFRLDDLVSWAEEAADEGSLLASREKLLHQAEQLEAELNAVDEVLAKAGATPADDRVEYLQVLATQHRRGVAVAEQVAGVVRERDLHRLAAEEAGNELDAIRDELRATGHPIGTRGLSYDVDAAIDRERSRAQDVVERLADALGQTEHAIWPHSAPRLLREVARLTGRSISSRRVRLSDWPAGSFMARQLACSCRASVAGAGSSVVDPRCAEHSPGYRFGGRPVQPLALPSGIREPVGWPQDLGCGVPF